MTSHHYNPGDMFSPRYKIVRHLGAGSFADVYLAEQTDVGRKVALKVLKQSVLQSSPEQSAAILSRFEQEARVISNLRDSHTVTLYDYGHHGDEYFMACEYVDGKSLGELLATRGRMPPARVVTILRQLLRSLQEAHAYGIIHRDVKPDNIFIYDHMGVEDRARLLDFGIAKFVDQEVDLTMEGTFVGTPRYAAPERIQSKPLQPSSDIYSLGLVAYQMLTGVKPFEGMDIMTTLRNQVLGPSLTLPKHEALPQSLREVIDRMINKDQTQRYQVAQPIIDALDRWEKADEPVAATVRLEAITASTLIMADRQRKHSGAVDVMDLDGPTTERPQVARSAPMVFPVSLEEMSEPHAQTLLNMDAQEVARQLAQARSSASYIPQSNQPGAMQDTMDFSASDLDTQDFDASDLFIQHAQQLASSSERSPLNEPLFSGKTEPLASPVQQSFAKPDLIQQDHSWTQQALNSAAQRTKGHDPNVNTLAPGHNAFNPSQLSQAQPPTDNTKKLLIVLLIGLGVICVVFALVLAVVLRLYVFKG